MKKILALAIMLVFTLTNEAYAANQFARIPANHWAYAAIDRLHLDGVIDSAWQGDATLTRYEAAQIVAVAMSKNSSSPELKKLTQEFAK